jgi:dihydropteroate synthase
LIVERLSENIDAKSYLKKIGVDGGGIEILSSKMQHYLVHIKGLPVGGANILKQDALSIGADLAVPRGTVIASIKEVDCLLIATQKQLHILSKKEMAQPFGLKEVAIKLKEILEVKQPTSVEVMGIINANDDSFFDGSRFKNKDAITKIEQMVEDGADIIDIGGVSSRPNAPVVSAKEEMQRLKPILDAIKEQKLYEKVRFSIDSYEPYVVEYALMSGFEILNDITGLQNDEVCKICARYDATAIIMHMQGTPQTMQKDPKYDDVLDDVYGFLKQRVQKAHSFGIKDIVLDVGIGFGKTLNDNLTLLKHLQHFLTLKHPLLVGASRKSMIDKISPSSVENRLAGTLTLHTEAIKNGASILRVHDVAEHIQAIRTLEALKL